MIRDPKLGRCVPRIVDAAAAVLFVRGRAEAAPGAIHYARTGHAGELLLGWRVHPEGWHELEVVREMVRPPRAPDEAERAYVERGLPTSLRLTMRTDRADRSVYQLMPRTPFGVQFTDVLRAMGAEDPR